MASATHGFFKSVNLIDHVSLEDRLRIHGYGWVWLLGNMVGNLRCWQFRFIRLGRQIGFWWGGVYFFNIIPLPKGVLGVSLYRSSLTGVNVNDWKQGRYVGQKIPFKKINI